MSSMTQNNLPKVTVITVVYNGAELLEDTIKSVINQTYSTLEYIIIDGGSTDGTLNLINKYSKKLKYWISEQDQGIYDAMNKGVKASSGEWLIFMNSGDWFYEVTTIEKIFLCRDLSTTEFVYGNTLKRSAHKIKVDIPSKASEFWKKLVVHQSIFSRKALNEKYPFDLNFKVSADFDFIFKVFYYRHQTLYVDEVISSFDMIGFSKQNRYLGFSEDRCIALKYRGNLIVGYRVYWHYIVITIRGKFIDIIRRWLPSLFNKLKELNR